MYDIICVGSATVDAFVSTGNRLFSKTKNNRVEVPFGSKILVDKLSFATGGGATNTAIAFSRLGLKTGIVCHTGTGNTSERIVTELKKEKVDTSMVARKSGRTGFSVVLDAKGHERTILAFKGSNNDLSYNHIKKSKLKTKWFYFSTMMEKSFRTLEFLANFALRHRINVAFNPSSYLARKGPKYLKKILAACTILVLNKGEAKEMLRKRTEDINVLLKGLYAVVPRLIVITDGKNGCFVYDGTCRYFVKPNPVKVKESTGAGDAFASGFVAGIIKGKGIEYALNMGLANAESVIQHFGAKNKLLTLREMNKFLKKKQTKVLIKKLK